jgi:putative addiction module CopG family antidote
MVTRQIELPPDQADWIDRRVEAGQYRDMSQYLAQLVERDAELEAAKQQLGKLLDEGRSSGEPIDFDDAAAERLRAEAMERINAVRESR